MKNLCVLFVILLTSFNFIISQDISNKKIGIKYIRPDGSEYIKYTGEKYYTEIVPSSNPNRLLVGDFAPESNMYFSEGTIVIEYNSAIPIFQSIENLASDIDMSIVDDLELNSFIVFPNPASNQTNIQFKIESDKQVRIELYSYDGKAIDVITDKLYHAGEYNVILEKKLNHSGTYMITFIAGEKQITKMVFLEK